MQREISVTQCCHTGNSKSSGGGKIIRDSVKLTSTTNAVTAQLIAESLMYTTLKNSTAEGGVDSANKNKEYDSQKTKGSTVPGSRSLTDGVITVTEETTTHATDMPLGNSCSGEPGNWSPEDDDDTRHAEENDNTYPIDVPLADSFHCRICAPIPKLYKRHGDLSKHIRRYHAQQLVFRCHGCSEVFATLKGCKRHQTSTDCGKLPVITRSPLQAPQPQQPNTLTVRRCRLPNLIPKEQPTTAPETRNAIKSSKHIDYNSTIVDQAYIDDDQTSAIEDLDIVPAAQAVNPDVPNSHTLTQQHASETVTNPTESAATDSELNISRADSTNNELGSKLAAEELHTLSDWQEKWIHRFNIIADSVKLEETLAEFTEEAKLAHQEFGAPHTQTRGEPTPRPPRQFHHRQRKQHGRQKVQYDAATASRLQKLYRYSRTRAIREVTEAEPTYCRISSDELFEHFHSIFQQGQPTDQTMPTEVPPHIECSPDDQNPFAGEFTPKEVWARLHRCGNTAPGPDGIRYAHWRKIDKGGHALNAVFNAVHRLGSIPQAWGKSVTILIFKKGDKSDISNWRPISLSNTIAKLYSSLLANRLGRWATRNGRISAAQKGFMSVDGCCEHNFALQAAIADARRSKRQCCIAWLDLTNAFGSVPHGTIFTCLKWAGLSEEAITVIRRLYAINTTNIRSQQGLTPEISIRAGVKQGCPLSPIVFNLAMEPIIRAVTQLRSGYSLYGESMDVLAYADDLTFVSDNPEGLQAMLDMADRVATWAGLKFNSRKCATLHMDGKRREALPTQFRIQEGVPPALSEMEVYEHLGIPTGYHIAPSADKALKDINLKLKMISDSLLAPWQKLDAINTFILPRVSFHLKNGVVQKGPLNLIDRDIKRIGKKCLNLPQRASAEPLYLSYQRGGVNLLPINVLADISQVVHGLGLLQSAHLGQLSMAFLKSVVRKRIRRLPEPQDVANYLCGSMEGAFANEPTDISNIWTRLRSATRRLRSKINVSWISDGDQITLCLNGLVLRRRVAEYALRNSIREYYRQKLLAKPDQGKVYEITSATNPPNHFLRNGDFTRFADWRFIHRARLDCVPLNGSQRFGNRNRQCRRCGYANETLPHVLCHCKPNFVSITKRHNAIQDRLVRAFNASASTTIRINQAVPGLDVSLRPDLVAVNETCKTVTIIDVTMPFENRYAAFQAARHEKQKKYAPLAEHYTRQGYGVFLDAFIVGALGGWDPANENIINHLKLGHSYCRLMRKLMVSDAIRWSRDIYIEHLSGVRQYQDKGDTRSG